MSNDNIKLMVVTHKEATMPGDNGLYVPTLVGPNKDNISFESYYRDDANFDNIAEKNANYCELTALYWAWKNLKVDYVGLVHYRRLFMEPNSNSILSKETLEDITSKYEIVLPRKRNYYIESTYSHYKHNHNISDLLKAREVIQEHYPEYVSSFDLVMKEKKSHRFNMFIMKKNKLDEYCSWLFDILFKVESQIDIDHYDAYQARIYGFLGERLLDVWIEGNQEKYAEIPVKFTEKQNWLIKGGKFLYKKFSA